MKFLSLKKIFFNNLKNINGNNTCQKVDAAELEEKVKKMYSDVALNLKGEYHFEMGCGLAEKKINIQFKVIQS